MPELPLNPTLLQDLEAAYSRNIEAGRVTPGSTHDLGVAAAAAANRHGNDIEELDLTRDQQEVAAELEGQLAISNQAYNEITTHMGIEHASQQEVHRLFELQLAQWAKNGTLDYVRENADHDPGLGFSLVISPNAVLNSGQLYWAAHDFAMEQDNPTGGKWADAALSIGLYDQYSNEELCGIPVSIADSRTPDVRFTLIPSKYTTDIPFDKPSVQRDAFDQYEYSETEAKGRDAMILKIPSVLDSIAWWYTLREEQRVDSLQPDKQLKVDSMEDTYIRHIDLTTIMFGGFPALPGSGINEGNNQPELDFSPSSDKSPVRVAVG